ncbi:MAG: AMP-binding protein [Bacillota bacterium]
MSAYINFVEAIKKNTNTNNKGITFINGQDDEMYLPYDQVIAKALGILYGLQQNGIRSGNELVFQLEDNQDFIYTFWACLLGGIIPVPVTVGNNDEHRLKLVKIWEILYYPYLITDSHTYKAVSTLPFEKGKSNTEDFSKKVILIDQTRDFSKLGDIYSPKPSDIAFIQFSSGSTGDPKGVIVTHENLVSNTSAIAHGSNMGKDDSIINWMPVTHDMGLIGAHLTGTLMGLNQYIMPTKLFIKRPTLWLSKASEHKVTHLYSPNFGYKHFLTFYDPKNAEDWDLSSIRVIFNGAEPISEQLCNTFLDEMEKHRLNRNSMFTVYGLAEATVGASFPPVGDRILTHRLDRRFLNVGQKIKEVEYEDINTVTFVDVGYPINDCFIRICDDENNALLEGTIGNIQISGINVTQGYYNNEEATKKVITQDGWLITGDLGFMKNKRLVITGRAKDIIFVNGQNYYPHDIERICEEVEEVELGKVAVCGVQNKKIHSDEIVIFVLFKKDLKKFCSMATALRSLINDKMGLEISAVIPVKKIPKTTSGKVQRYKLGQMYQEGEFAQVKAELEKLIAEELDKKQIDLPTNDIERRLVEIWSKVLGNTNTGINDSFFELGGNSISLMQIIDKVDNEFNVEMSFTEFMSKKTIAEIANLINENRGEIKGALYPQRQTDIENIGVPFPLSEVQMAYYTGRSDQFELGGTSTHLYIEIETKLDIELLNKSLQKLIGRHPMLRAIVLDTGEQKILAKVPDYEIEVKDLRHLNTQEQKLFIEDHREDMSHRVLKPNQWPLFEFKAIRLTDDTSLLCVGIDMLIADGASIQIIGRELVDFYNNQDMILPRQEFSFRDYMLAYEEFKSSELYRRDKEYWINKLEEFPSSPALPLKQEPYNVKKPRFKRQRKVFDKKDWERLKNIARKNSITSSVLLCTAYAAVLAFWSNQPKLAISLTTLNRYPFNPGVNDIVGDFTSVMLLDIEMQSNTSFWEKAKGVQDTLLKALEHRHYDGVEFIRDISKYHNMGTKAAMPVVFTSMLFGESRDGWSEMGEIKMGISQTSQVYLDNQVIEIDGSLSITWDYVEQLFDSQTIKAMFENYIGILDSILENESASNLAISSCDRELIRQYNNTDLEVRPTTLQEMFISQVRRTPDNLAVIFEGQSITYRVLHERTNRIAHYLREKGIGENDLVGVIANRSIDAIVNVMGILKSGAAYVPLNLDYPESRKKYIIEDAKCKAVLEGGFFDRERISAYPGEEVSMDYDPESLAYVIYTSGSTGKPKGVVITHKAVTNTIEDINKKFSVNEKDRLIGLSSMCFDLSVYDIFGALSTGAALVVVKDQRDVKNVIETIKSKGVTIWNSVPSILDITVDSLEESPERQNSNAFEDKYYWSPVVQWKKQGNQIWLKDISYKGVAAEMFPKLYFLAQEGITPEDMAREFPDKTREELEQVFNQMVMDKVLVNSILTPEEIFSTQKKLFRNTYSDEILYNPLEYNKFKKLQLERSFKSVKSGKKQLLSKEYPQFITGRYSHRTFKEDAIPYEVFSQLLSIFKSNRNNDSVRYYYASAGGLYPIDIFVYVKKDRIENVEQGLYYYSPVENSLYLVNSGQLITEGDHYSGNRPIFGSSAFSVFFVYNAETNMPKYGSMGYFYACIDCGIMVSTLTQAAELLNIGLCSIGDMFFNKVRHKFNLDENQVLIHTVEGGLKLDCTLANFGNSSLNTMGEVAASEEWTQKAALMEELPNVGDKQERTAASGLDSLRLILLSGDWIPLKLPERAREVFSNAEVISLGGATEASIWSIYFPINEIRDNWKSIPYGIPLVNQKFYVLNHEGNLCPVGVKGELYIGGIGLAREYLNDEEKTSAAFIKHHELGGLYKTGDYGVMHRDGYIEFLGRMDSQIKIRGYRVELGEIETCLVKHDDIKSAIVIDYQEQNGKKSLAAYVAAERPIASLNIREYLLGQLPDYMVPAYFIQVDDIPLTANGKVDRKALPKPDKSSERDTDYIEPVNEIEKKLAGIWKQVLETDRIGINDNFFELGGNSILLIKVHSQIDKIYPGKLTVSDMFAYPTISKLVEFINKGNKVPVKDIPIKSLSLPEEFFTNGSEVNDYSEFKFKIDDELCRDIRAVSQKEDTSIYDIFLSIYAYLLSQIAQSQEAVVNTPTEDNTCILALGIDTDEAESIEDLIKLTAVKRRVNHHAAYPIEDISRIGLDKSGHWAAPLFCKKNLDISGKDLLDIYDIILVIEEENSCISFTCEYDFRRLKKEKVKDLLGRYVKLLKALVLKIL